VNNPYTDIEEVIAFQNEFANSTCKWSLDGSGGSFISEPCKAKLTNGFRYDDAGTYQSFIRVGDKDVNCGLIHVEGFPIRGCLCTADSLNPNVTYGSTSVKWKVSGCTTEGGTLSYDWDGATGTSTTATKTFTAKGEYASPTVVVSNTDGVSTTVYCPAVRAVASALPIEGCTCGAPELQTTSDDVTDYGSVIYRWSVDGCTNEVDENFSYAWTGKKFSSNEGASVYAQYTGKGAYTASVRVTNERGDSVTVQCPDTAKVKDRSWTFKCDESNSILFAGGSYSNYIGLSSYSAEQCFAVPRTSFEITVYWSSTPITFYVRRCSGTVETFNYETGGSTTFRVDADGTCDEVYLYADAVVDGAIQFR
jgi:hypothetical protein